MPGKLLAGGMCQIWTRRSGSSKGSGRSMAALTMEKIAVLAPMPSARTRMAPMAKAGLWRSVRRDWRRSEIRLRMGVPLGIETMEGGVAFYWGGWGLGGGHGGGAPYG